MAYEDQMQYGSRGPTSFVGRFLARHGRKLWWMHSLYALGLGISVLLFARKGFAHARWLVVSLVAAWLLILLVFRLVAARGGRDEIASDGRGRLRVFVMTYVLKNLYQGMLFFLLPFYWKSTTLDSQNRWFLALLGSCAVVSTLDVVFDHMVMRFRWLASLFYMVTLFACVNLVIPALLPDTPTLDAEIAAAAFAALALWSLYVTRRAFAEAGATIVALGALVLLMGGAVGLVYGLRGAIPPVPMHVARAAVGPKTLDDGRLMMEVTTLHRSLLAEMVAVTDVVIPGGEGDRLVHVWRHEGAPVRRFDDDVERQKGPRGTIRLRSRLAPTDLPANPVGAWTVDVETEDGQIVGRARFAVIE